MRQPAMPRRKIAMRYIENARARAARYAQRSKGLQKMASKLATLCGIPVALVCSPAAGASAGATRLVWESQEGVLDRYRATAVPPETRARHTHRGYLEAELGKETAKLARVRPGKLPDWDPALNDMTPDVAREVLDTIDAALRAAGDRMAALGLPADGRLELEQVALAPDDDASDDAAVAPQQFALDMDMDYAGFQLQMMPYQCHGQGGNSGGDGLLEQFLMQPGYGLDCVCGGGGGGSYDVGAVNETQAPGGYGDNADCGWPDLTMCYAADESGMPVEYYPDPDFADGTLASGHYSAQDFTGGDYADTLPLEYPMGMDENFGYLGMDSSYAAHWQVQELQRPDTGTRHYQYQCSDPGNSSGQVFHYPY